MQELGRRLKTTNPVVAEIFTLMSRDEARHAGFLNKAMSDFNLALDLGFLTKNRCVGPAVCVQSGQAHLLLAASLWECQVMPDVQAK